MHTDNEQSKFNSDDYLQQVLARRAEEMGGIGKWRILIKYNKPVESELLTIHSLTEEKARNIFDLIDEYNFAIMPLRVLLISPTGEEEDECLLPNIFTSPQ